MTTWEDETPIYLLDDNEAPRIVEKMREHDHPVDLNVDEVWELIVLARSAYRKCLSDWRYRYDPRYKVERSTGPYAAWENTGRGNPGRLRDGSGIPIAPLAAIYYRCNWWWRERRIPKPHTAFRCDFEAWDFACHYDGDVRNEFINPPALFFCLIASAVSELDYTVERCIQVDRYYYRKLPTKVPPLDKDPN